MRIKLNFIQKIFCIILIFSFLPIGNTKTVKADALDSHSTYYTKTIINEKTLSYDLKVEFDENAWGKSAERKKGISWGTVFSYGQDGSSVNNNKFGFLDKIAPDSNYNETNLVGDNPNYLEDSINTNTGLIFTFPGFKRETTRWFGVGDNANQADMNRAYKVSEKLVNNLNLLIKELTKEMGISLKNNEGVNDVNKFISTSIALRPTSAGIGTEWAHVELNNSYQIWYALEPKTEDTRSSLEGDSYGVSDFINELPRSDIDGNLYAYLIRSDNNLSKNAINRLSPIIWAMPKGYIDVNTGEGFNSKYSNTLPTYALSGTKVSDGSDTAYMTIFHYSYFANYNYLVEGISVQNTSTEESGWIARTIYNLMSTVLYQVKNLLGLEDIYDLVYNGGIRGTATYEEGTMNSSWWNTVLKYHIIFQVVAWMLIGLAIAKILVELNLSTINPQKRMSIMSTLQKLFAVGFLLALAIPVIRALVSTNNLIVDIFRTQAQSDGDAFAMNGNIASIFSYASYFGILVIINCMYIMRSIMIAILSASAPFFIVTMAFSSKGQGLFSTWFKEITANIFMQSIHAFAFAFLFDVIDSGRMIERIVIFWSLIPIVDTFRNLIFQNSGSFASSQGQAVGSKVHQHMKSAAAGIGNGALNAGSNALSKKYGIDKADEVSGSDGSGGSSSGGKNDTAVGRASDVLDKVAAEREKRGKKSRMAKIAKVAMNGSAKAFKVGSAIGQMGVSSNLGDSHGFSQAAQSFKESTAEAVEGLGGLVDASADFVSDKGGQVLDKIDNRRLDNFDEDRYTEELAQSRAALDYESNSESVEAHRRLEGKNARHQTKKAKIDKRLKDRKLKRERKDILRNGGVDGRVIDSAYGPKTIIGLNNNNTWGTDASGQNVLNIETGDLNKDDIRKETVKAMNKNKDFADFMKLEGFSSDDSGLQVRGATRSRDKKSAVYKGNLNSDLDNYAMKFNNMMDKNNTPDKKVQVGSNKFEEKTDKKDVGNEEANNSGTGQPNHTNPNTEIQ